MGDTTARAGRPETRRWLPVLSWALSAALFVAVVAVALHFAQLEAFARLARQASPLWLLVALALQAATYLAQGLVFGRVARAAGRPLPVGQAVALSLAKVFADQALPSAGVGSSVVVARGLQRLRLPAGAVRAAVVVNLVSYYLVYVLALPVALVLLQRAGRAHPAVVVATLLFLALSAGFAAGALLLAGRRGVARRDPVRRLPGVRRAVAFVAGARPALARSPRLMGEALALQAAIVVLDAATLWALVASVGVLAPPGGIFASFMIASLFRAVGIVPGGLGTFEASSILTLRLAGVPLAPALAATLLFRGVSTWLPLLPGWWCSRRFSSGRARR